VKALFCVMVDRRAKRFEIPARAPRATAMFRIAGAGLSIDLRQRLSSPVVIEAVDPGLNLELIAGLADIGQID
jgi:hypothetical protein